VSEAPDRWRLLYRVGGIVAFVALGLMVLDIVLTMLPGWTPASVPTSTSAWLTQLADDPLLGMRNLDLLNVIASVVVLPLYIAIFAAVRRTEPGLALVGLAIVALGTAVFAASNAALPMLELGRRFSATLVPAERSALVAAADALLARGAHGSYGAFPGFALSEIGTLVTGIALARSRAFGAATAWVGILGVTVLLGYTTAYTFISPTSSLVLLAAMPGGLLMIAWYVLVGRRLITLATRIP
jgi:hypothetical protein